MRTFTTTFLALASFGLAAADYQIDPAHTTAMFKISHMGFSWTYGRFNDVSGSVSYDAAKGLTGANVVIKTASVDTATKKKDDHLRSGDFFNVVEFPQMTFVATSIGVAAEGVQQVTGDFTLLDTTKQIVIPVTLMKAGQFPPGVERVGFDTHFTIKRSDFGMSFMVDGSDEVTITFAGEAIIPK